jgi:hypothetical protein
MSRGINCDLEVPCNGCIRRHKTHLCGKLPGEERSKRVKRESLLSPELEEVEATEDTEMAYNTDMDMVEGTQLPTDTEEHNEAAVAESDGAGSTTDALTLRLSPRSLEKLYMSGRLTVLDESGMFKATYNIIRVDDGAFLSGRNDEHIVESEEATDVEQSPPGPNVDVPNIEKESPSSAPSQSAHNDQISRPRRSRARVSYAEAPPSDVSNHDSEVDTESDTYESYGESEGDDEQSVDEAEGASSQEEGDSLENTDVDDVEPETLLKARRKSQNGHISQRKAGKGIDQSLPPLHDIQGIFDDLTQKAVELGLCDALAKLAGRPINVATMCSGTESPLIALDRISQGMFIFEAFYST